MTSVAAGALAEQISRLQSTIESIQRDLGREVERSRLDFSHSQKPADRRLWNTYIEQLRRIDQTGPVSRQLRTAYSQFASQLSSASQFQTAEHTSKGVGETFGRQLPPKTIVLTFDDGPHVRYTDRIMKELDDYQA